MFSRTEVANTLRNSYRHNGGAIQALSHCNALCGTSVNGPPINKYASRFVSATIMVARFPWPCEEIPRLDTPADVPHEPDGLARSTGQRSFHFSSDLL